MREFKLWFGLAARLTLGGVLLVAGFLKYDEIDKSQMAVRAYEMLPVSLANFIGIVLPFAEIGMGLLLILGAVTRITAALSALLMVVFVIGISQAWARGLSIDCGCFGGEARLSLELLTTSHLSCETPAYWPLGFIFFAIHKVNLVSINRHNRRI